MDVAHRGGATELLLTMYFKILNRMFLPRFFSINREHTISLIREEMSILAVSMVTNRA